LAAQLEPRAKQQKLTPNPNQGAMAFSRWQRIELIDGAINCSMLNFEHVPHQAATSGSISKSF
jgi:hypothetical protein